MKPTRNIAEVIRAELEADRSLAETIEKHALDAEIATLVYDARREAGLTQQQLADLIGTQQSVIARLEDWDYSGHSLTMLKRIGDVLGKKLHVEFRPRFNDCKLESQRISDDQRKQHGTTRRAAVKKTKRPKRSGKPA